MWTSSPFSRGRDESARPDVSAAAQIGFSERLVTLQLTAACALAVTSRSPSLASCLHSDFLAQSHAVTQLQEQSSWSDSGLSALLKGTVLIAVGQNRTVTSRVTTKKKKKKNC